MISEAGAIYRHAIKEISRVLKRGHRLVIVSPYVRVEDGGVVGLQLHQTLSAAGFEPYLPKEITIKYPIFPESQSDQTVLRSLYVSTKR